MFNQLINVRLKFDFVLNQEQLIFQHQSEDVCRQHTKKALRGRGVCYSLFCSGDLFSELGKCRFVALMPSLIFHPQTSRIV